MKIISNDDVYIQGNDLEQLLHNDKTFPLDIYYASTKGMPHVESLTKFIRIEGEKAKKFIRKVQLFQILLNFIHTVSKN